MASKLTSYHPPTPIQSSLLKKIPDSIPATNDLKQLQDELEKLKKLSLARSKKAGDDMKAIDESMRRMREREKGKARALEKIKRERDFTPSLDTDDAKSTHSHLGINHKSRLSSSLPGSNRNSVDPRRPSADDVKKKKKRKFEDSDGERDQRPRKSPPLTHLPPHPPPLKAQKSVLSASHAPTKPPPGPDFTLPTLHPLLPPRPPIQPAPIPGPSKPTDVMDDFSKLKQPTQITSSTFYTSIEPWIRPIREEDVGFLEYTGDEVEPYILPKLGRHYLEVWEDQDAGLLPIIPALSNDAASSTSFDAPQPKWDPSTLAETDLQAEGRGHGPLTERVISALLPLQDNNWKGVKAAEDAMEGRPGGSGAAAARKERLNVTELEARIRDTMRYHGLLEGVPDFTEKVDDPIATALRHAQRELRKVVATNKARKQRLIPIAMDRLAYQEYLEARDSIDRNISTLYGKLQKKDIPKSSKKKKIKGNDPGSTELQNGMNNHSSSSLQPAPIPCPAALGLNPDDELVLHVNEQLQQLVKTRRMWVDMVGAVFDEKQRAQPGRIWGLPADSAYAGVQDEVRAVLMAQEREQVQMQVAEASVNVNGAVMVPGSSPTSSLGSQRKMEGVKHPVVHEMGKAKAIRGDDMDIG